MNKLQMRPCTLLGWAYCDGNCEKNCRATASTTFTPYDPIEVARQYAPKFDKPVVDMVAVVRCKDCKTQKTCNFAQYQGNNGYCLLGERKDEVEE